MNWSRQGKTEPNQSDSISVFYTAIFFALIAGLGEIGVFAYEKFTLHYYIHQNPDVIWMAPLVDMLFFSSGALFFWIVSRRLPRIIPRWLPVFSFSFVCYTSLLVLATWLGWVPLLILAIGLAAETARLIGDHPAGFERLLNLTLGWARFARSASQPTEPQSGAIVPASESALTRRQFLVSTGTVLAGLTLGSWGPDILEDWVALARLPAPPRDAPNVLLITLDTVRAQSLSLYGYSRMTTPNLERLAKNGVLFQRAIAPASWTLPSHASMFTGHLPHELSADRKNPLDAKYPTLAEVLSTHGYLTAGFVANLEYCTSESGLGQGFIDYDDYDVTPASVVAATSLGNFLSQRPKIHQLANNWNTLGRKPASQVNTQFLSWLDRRDARPFFAFLNYFDAHSPYYPPAPFDKIFGPITPRDSPIAEKWIHVKDVPTAVLQAEMNAYDGSIAYIDQQVGLLFDELGKRGVLENTLVIIASDHGEEFGEHNIFSHGQSLYLPSLHVPLLIIYPGQVPAGKSVEKAVSLRDLATTIMDLTHLESTVTFPGDSLVRFWDGSFDPKDVSNWVAISELKYAGGFPDWFPISRGNLQSLVTEGHHYIKFGDGVEELYDWQADPWEQSNLSGTEKGREKLVHLRNLFKTVATA
jgi:arylsulfatase A-like enzyme